MSSDSDKSEVKVFKFGEESLSDVIFVIDDNEFHCHRMLLAAKSPFFAAMFTSGFKEKNEERIEMKETDAVAFRRLMQILYDSRIEKEFLFVCDCCTVNSTIELWTDTCALFALADRCLVLDMVRHVVELYFLADECLDIDECEDCPMKLLLALRFKMDKYKSRRISPRRQYKRVAVLEALERLKNIQDESIFNAETAVYLMKLS